MSYLSTYLKQPQYQNLYSLLTEVSGSINLPASLNLLQVEASQYCRRQRRYQRQTFQMQLATSTLKVENIKIMLGFEIKEHFLSCMLMDKAFSRSNESDTYTQLIQCFFSFSKSCCTTKLSHTDLEESGYMNKVIWVNSVMQM